MINIFNCWKYESVACILVHLCVACNETGHENADIENVERVCVAWLWHVWMRTFQYGTLLFSYKRFLSAKGDFIYAKIENLGMTRFSPVYHDRFSQLRAAIPSVNFRGAQCYEVPDITDHVNHSSALVAGVSPNTHSSVCTQPKPFSILYFVSCAIEIAWTCSQIGDEHCKTYSWHKIITIPKDTFSKVLTQVCSYRSTILQCFMIVEFGCWHRASPCGVCVCVYVGRRCGRSIPRTTTGAKTHGRTVTTMKAILIFSLSRCWFTLFACCNARMWYWHCIAFTLYIRVLSLLKDKR